MRLNDAVLGAIIVVFGLFVFYEASTFPPLPGQSYGPGFFPAVIGGVFIASGAILVIQGVLVWKKTGWGSFGPWISSPRHVVNTILVLGFLVAYILLDTVIGFIPLSLVIVTVLIRRFGGSMLQSVAAAVISTAVIHTIFYYLLAVQLPWGILRPIAW